MTVTIYSNAAITAAYASTRYTATVNGNAAPVLISSGTAEYDVPGFWDESDVLECGLLKIAADEAVEVVISPVDGDPAITSAVVFPERIGVTVANGVATIQLPAGEKVRLETNGERGQPVVLRSMAPLTTPTGPTVDIYDGTQVAALSGRTLVFLSGIIDLVGAGTWGDILFPMQANASVFIHGNCRVIGNLDGRTDNWDIDGHGTLSGEFETADNVAALPTFLEQIEYSMVLGNNNDGVFRSGTTLKNITIVNQPYYAVLDAANIIEGVTIVGFASDNLTGISVIGDRLAGFAYSVSDCFVWAGDDAMILDHWRGIGTVTNCHITTSGSACFLHLYRIESWQVEQPTYGVTITDCLVRPVCDYYTIGVNEGGAIIQCWTDGPRSDLLLGTFNVTYRNLRVESDDNGINCVLMYVGNRGYTWGDVQDLRGQLSGWLLDGVTLSHVPAEVSKVRGLGSGDTPNGIAFKDLAIGGVPVSARNHDTYFDIDEECFNITFDGRSV